MSRHFTEAALILKDYLRSMILLWFSSRVTPSLSEKQLVELCRDLQLYANLQTTVEEALFILEELENDDYLQRDRDEWILTQRGDEQAFGEPPWKLLRNTLGG